MDTNAMTPSPRCTDLTDAGLCHWLGTAVPGDRLIYHQGFLAVDCDPASDRLTPRQKEQLRRVARRAFLAADNGLVHLLQSRNGPGDYSYILVARPRPRPPKGSLPLVLAADAD